MLIETAQGVINTDHVVTAEQVDDTATGATSTRVRFVDGTEKRVEVLLLSFEQACGVIVPAPAGFTLVKSLLPHKGEEGVVYTEEPVIAFRVSHGSYAHSDPIPITISGEPRSLMSQDPWTVRQPHGVCVGPEGEHSTLDAFKAFCGRTAEQGRESV